MESLRPNQERARNAVLIFWMLLGFTALALVYNVFELQLVRSSDITDNKLKYNNFRQMMIGVSVLVLNILCIIFFILWFRRAYANLHRLGTQSLEQEEVWAGMSWFIPIINLYRPYNIMKEVWIETQEVYKGEGRADSHVLLGFWWALFIGKSVINMLANKIKINAWGVNGYTKASIANIIGDVITIIAILVTIELIRRVSKYEEALYESKHEFDIARHLVADTE